MIVSMFLVLLVLIVILCGFRLTQYMLISDTVEDALAASNLASAVIDIKEFGKSHSIRIQDPEKAYMLYREALCHNLHLDEYLNTTNQEIIASKVTIEEYIVYNVFETLVEIYVLDGNGQIKKCESGMVGQVFTPDGVCVETTTVYSRISFLVKGLFDGLLDTCKEKSVDIVRCEIEQ